MRPEGKHILLKLKYRSHATNPRVSILTES
jgi:hypothetical protein